MNLKSIDVEVDKDAPFRNDDLDRRDFVTNLKTLLSNSEENLVVALYGRYGSGKSTILKMLQAELERGGTRTSVFNAWENDYSQDPLPVFINKIAADLSLQTETLTRLKDAGISIVKNALPAAVKAATLGIVDLSETTEAVVGAAAQALAKSAFESTNAHQDLVRKFRSTIAEAIQTKGRLVVLVDEMDRCRPDFALSVLERIKHLFNVPSIKFVIAVDEDQMSFVVRNRYGNGSDAGGYLRRFIDLSFAVPTPAIASFVRSEFRRMGFDEYFETRKGHGETKYDGDQFENLCIRFSELYDLTLRDTQKWLSRIAIVLLATPADRLLFPFSTGYLTLLSVARPRIYKRLAERELGILDLVSHIESLPKGHAFLYDEDENDGQTLIANMVITLHSRKSGESTYAIADRMIEDDGQPQATRGFWKNVKEYGQFLRRGRSFDNLMADIVAKIDFVESTESPLH